MLPTMTVTKGLIVGLLTRSGGRLQVISNGGK